MQFIARADPELFAVFDSVINSNNYGYLTPNRVRELFASVLAVRVSEGYLSFNDARVIMANTTPQIAGGYASRGFRAVGGAMTAYLQALKKWNDKPDRWCSPRKNTPAHAEVMRIVKEIKDATPTEKPAENPMGLPDDVLKGVEITNDEIAEYAKQKQAQLGLPDYVFNELEIGDDEIAEYAKQKQSQLGLPDYVFDELEITDDEIADYLAEREYLLDVQANVDNAREMLVNLTPEEKAGNITDAEIAEKKETLDDLSRKIAQAFENSNKIVEAIPEAKLRARKPRAVRAKTSAKADPPIKATFKAKRPTGVRPKAPKPKADAKNEDVDAWIAEQTASAKNANERVEGRKAQLREFEAKLDARALKRGNNPVGVWKLRKPVELNTRPYEIINKVVYINPKTLDYPTEEGKPVVSTKISYDLNRYIPTVYDPAEDLDDMRFKQIFNAFDALNTRDATTQLILLVILAEQCRLGGANRKYAPRFKKMCADVDAKIKELGLSAMPKYTGDATSIVNYFDSVIPIISIADYEIPAVPLLVSKEQHDAFYTAVITWNIFKKQNLPIDAKAKACMWFVRSILLSVRSAMGEASRLYEINDLLDEIKSIEKELIDHAPMPNGLINKYLGDASSMAVRLRDYLPFMEEQTKSKVRAKLLKLRDETRDKTLVLSGILKYDDPALMIVSKINDIIKQLDA